MPTTSSDFYLGGPEVMLRIRGLSMSAERGEARIETGPWLADPAAGVTRGGAGRRL
ncbi:hypothetical protein [Gordonia amicalis]|uniref:hypothetical protein n=1 Tax=Gordonia amicalis TaxID=89053 RepID=UPI0028704D04|nr:hypothetical protein [Gordonia amicalis]